MLHLKEIIVIYIAQYTSYKLVNLSSTASGHIDRDNYLQSQGKIAVLHPVPVSGCHGLIYTELVCGSTWQNCVASILSPLYPSCILYFCVMAMQHSVPVCSLLSLIHNPHVRALHPLCVGYRDHGNITSL